MQNEIARSAYEYQKNIDNKEQIVIGVNKYKDDDPKTIETFDIDIDSANEQVDSLKIYKNNRDNLSVQARLEELKVLAKSNDNIIPILIKCIHSQCTLGEMSDALREIFGDFSE